MKVLHAPRSKSLSHRILISAALCAGESKVYNLLDCDDTRKTMAVLTKAGAKFTSLSKNEEEFKDFLVQGMGENAKGGNSLDESTEAYIGESGTSGRLLTAILSQGSGYFKLCGAPRMHERPMASLVNALRSIGAEITAEKEGYAPLYIHAQKLKGGKCEIALDESSQYLSGLLLLAPLCEDGLSLIPVGSKAVSWPYVALTLQTMQEYGIKFEITHLADNSRVEDWKERSEIAPHSICIKVEKNKYKTGSYTVEGDWSGASYLLAAGALGKEAVKVLDLNIHSAQADRALLSILEKMKAKIQINEDCVIVEPSSLEGIDVDMNACPDIVPTVAVLAACAKGITRITNVPHLRVKESDRIFSVLSELKKVGIKFEELADGMIIYGNGSMPEITEEIQFSAHNDHRIAMSMSLFGLHGAKLSFDDKKVVNKSFPEFWNVLDTLLA